MPFWKTYKAPRSRILEEKTKKNGFRHTIFSLKGDTYRGEWKNDQMDGKGVFLTKKNQKLYEGEWKNGKKDGYGVMSILLEDGTRALDVEGTWSMGKPEGQVKKHYTLGSNEAFPEENTKRKLDQKSTCYVAYFEGRMKAGKRDGHGRMWYADGSFYEGDWRCDMRHGLGLFVEVNGNRYEGEWRANKKHGYGQYFHTHSGQMQYGMWKNGIPISTVIKDIGFRQACERPTPYPIPENELLGPDKLYEDEVKHFIRDQEKEPYTAKVISKSRIHKTTNLSPWFYVDCCNKKIQEISKHGKLHISQKKTMK